MYIPSDLLLLNNYLKKNYFFKTKHLKNLFYKTQKILFQILIIYNIRMVYINISNKLFKIYNNKSKQLFRKM